MLQFRSIRNFVTVTAGACLLAVVVVLVLYSLMAMTRTQQQTASRTEAQLSDAIQARLQALGEAQASDISARLDGALQTARELAQTNAMMAQPATGEALLPIDRQAMSRIVRQRVIDNPDLLDAFIGWEPNAFDNDADYLGQTALGYGEDGRFMPWWYRTANGSIEVLGLGSGMESTRVMESGIREGEYYLCTRETGRACVTDPHPYDYNGTTMLVTSFNVPIMVNGTFRGSAGVDLSLDFIQGVLVAANQGLYKGVGSIALVSDAGTIVGYSGDAQSPGRPASGFFSADTAQQLVNGGDQSIMTTAGDDLSLQLPVDIGDATRWQLLLRVPKSAVYADFNALQEELADQQRNALMTMALVGLLVSALGLGAIWLVGRRIARPLKNLAERMRQIANGDGDLTQRLPVEGRDEPAQLASAFNQFVDRMETVLIDIRDSSHSVQLAAAEISAGGHDLSRRTETTAANLEESAAAMEELTSTVEHSATSTKEANGLAHEAAGMARGGGEQMQGVVATMARIRETSGKIESIVDVIDGIAFQTNLLALNASVEAARAGEQGRGFAVVAQEVRNLANRSAQAATDIKTLITTSSRETTSGAELVDAASHAMGEIVERVSRVSTVIDELSRATGEQSTGIGQVNQAITQLDDMTQQNAALVEQSAAAAESLSQQAQRLATTVGAFRLSH
ncbi:methyl-accepting chemotaxis sensory transducer with Cache sensor [Kushneria avicenniae]|uniref:Methyl-accepting chemotaxis sensory transducer with Cache sensor n=1 Tax=Kushneria avicenniae TaxID=402385 RepID=A0A1I1JBE7_9GAMM|nr:methyl-accepting chemotaxis protein [Kushneria avicenniae]SFC45695.1 methyl-accepting chemotaxis sensory transducer with Cache sensor [Kushneria avicenniae]